MNEEQLRIELEAILLARHQSRFERMRMQQAELDALSEEDWWQRHLDAAARIDPETVSIVARARESLIANRAERSRYVHERAEAEFIAKKSSEIMPELLAIRKDLGADGPITEDQFHRASIQASFTQARQRLFRHQYDVFRHTIQWRQKPALDHIAEVGRKLEQLQRSRDPSTLTEEDVEAVVSLLDRGMKRTPLDFSLSEEP